MSSDFTDYDTALLPAPVLSYLDGDRSPASADLFSADAVVLDDGRTYTGTDAIRRWIRTASTEYEYTKTRLGQQFIGGDRVVLLIRLDGNFPGGTATLLYRFHLRDGLIDRLEIGA